MRRAGSGMVGIGVEAGGSLDYEFPQFCFFFLLMVLQLSHCLNFFSKPFGVSLSF